VRYRAVNLLSESQEANGPHFLLRQKWGTRRFGIAYYKERKRAADLYPPIEGNAVGVTKAT